MVIGPAHTTHHSTGTDSHGLHGAHHSSSHSAHGTHSAHSTNSTHSPLSNIKVDLNGHGSSTGAHGHVGVSGDVGDSHVGISNDYSTDFHGHNHDTVSGSWNHPLGDHGNVGVTASYGTGGDVTVGFGAEYHY